VEIEAALDKIYGKPIPGEVIEVESAECGVRNGGASALQLSPPEEERGRGREAEAEQ